jgi:hypothetical protein
MRASFIFLASVSLLLPGISIAGEDCKACCEQQPSRAAMVTSASKETEKKADSNAEKKQKSDQAEKKEAAERKESEARKVIQDTVREGQQTTQQAK